VIDLSPQQHQILEQITRQTTNAYRLVRRAQVVLGAAQGKSNTALSVQLDLSRNQVQYWRDRWQNESAELMAAECESVSAVGLRQRIEATRRDQARPGTGAKFSVEEIVQIVAVACELPALSGRPSRHWSPTELADEVMKRGIVASISPRTVGRFLK
jgi:putative transposase